MVGEKRMHERMSRTGGNAESMPEEGMVDRAGIGGQEEREMMSLPDMKMRRLVSSQERE